MDFLSAPSTARTRLLSSQTSALDISFVEEAAKCSLGIGYVHTCWEIASERSRNAHHFTPNFWASSPLSRVKSPEFRAPMSSKIATLTYGCSHLPPTPYIFYSQLCARPCALLLLAAPIFLRLMFSLPTLVPAPSIWHHRNGPLRLWRMSGLLATNRSTWWC